MPSSDQFVAVSFQESECITRAGATTTTYSVFVDRAWQPVYRVATAIARSLPSSPGVVWMRIVELHLRVGTEVERIVEVPRRDRRANTGDVLFGRSSGLRRSRRHVRLVVAVDGRLTALTRR